MVSGEKDMLKNKWLFFALFGHQQSLLLFRQGVKYVNSI